MFVLKTKIDFKNRRIHLTQINSAGRALIVGGMLKNWDITFNGINFNIISNFFAN